MQKNVLGASLRPCSRDPITGFFRNGCCETDEEDTGEHTACTELTEAFLSFSKKAGNDLSTPRPEFGFSGLLPGQKWCVCASRWIEAFEAGVIAPLVLEATHESMLDFLPLTELRKHSTTPAE